MRISSKKLLHLPVFTESGENLGKIAEIIVNIDTHLIEQYVVHASHLIEDIFAKELVIDNSQILSINNDRMVVNDLISKKNSEVFGAHKFRNSKSAPLVSL
jgi:sporulation protein YlmC with PRC-barrel domain